MEQSGGEWLRVKGWGWEKPGWYTREATLQLYESAPISIQLATEKFWVESVVADIPTADLVLNVTSFGTRGTVCTIKKGKANKKDVLHIESRGLKLPTQIKVPPLSEQLFTGSIALLAQ